MGLLLQEPHDNRKVNSRVYKCVNFGIKYTRQFTLQSSWIIDQLPTLSMSAFPGSFQNEYRFMNKPPIVVVTGTSTGLGLSIAIQSALQGATVYATMRNLDKRDTLEAAAAQAGVTMNILQLDVEDSSSVQNAIDSVVKAEGRLDVLVANAGVGFARSTEQASEEDIHWVMDVNFMGVVRCVKAAIPTLRQQRSGRVIAISSVGGLVGQPFNEVYCASKFAVEGYIESLASYVGPAFGLHFTTIEPGGISSEFADRALKQIEQSGGMLEDEYLPIIQKYMGTRSTRTEGIYQTPDEIAKVVVDCMNDEAPPVRLRTSAWSEEFTRLKTQADPDGKKQQARVIQEMLGGF